MDLQLTRKWFTDRSTVGELAIDGIFECFTLEDVVREGDIVVVKVSGQTAIPADRYQVVITPSPRFQRDLPLLLQVPDFDGIRIHAGNTDQDTEGCILVGCERGDDVIGRSRDALEAFLPKLRAGLAQGPVHITIVNARAGARAVA